MLRGARGCPRAAGRLLLARKLSGECLWQCVRTGSHNDFVHCRAGVASLGVHNQAQAESVENNRMAGCLQSRR
eukprot:4296893-Pyramimonas_sp.AAC.1